MKCDLLLLYRWAILSSVIAAPGLALLGCQIAARDKAVQALCVSQGAMLGAVVAVFFEHFTQSHWLCTPIVFLGAALAFFLGERFTSKMKASRNTLLIALFSGLLALGYLFSALFPGVESHMTQVFFGDLATLSNTASFALLGLGTAGLIWIVSQTRTITTESFFISTFGSTQKTGNENTFSFITLIWLAISVQFVGFLFTIAMLFVPTAVGIIGGTLGMRAHLTIAALMAVLGTGSGFHLSLHNSRLPTVPTIVIATFVSGLLLSSGVRIFRKRQA